MFDLTKIWLILWRDDWTDESLVNQLSAAMSVLTTLGTERGLAHITEVASYLFTIWIFKAFSGCPSRWWIIFGFQRTTSAVQCSAMQCRIRSQWINCAVLTMIFRSLYFSMQQNFSLFQLTKFMALGVALKKKGIILEFFSNFLPLLGNPRSKNNLRLFCSLDPLEFFWFSPKS